MSFRRNNSTLSAIATMSNRSSSLSRDESNTIAFAIDQLRQEIYELKTLIYEQQASNNELINILAPIFPRDINKEAFAKASEAAYDAATASMVNANLRGDRFIPKVPSLAKAGSSSAAGTPSNVTRIKSLLKILKGHEASIDPDTISDEEIQKNYQFLKVSARQIHQMFMMDHIHLKDLTWSKLGELNPALKAHLTLVLEKKAFDNSINLHCCEDMWGADRLMFEAFRGSRASNASRNSNSNGMALARNKRRTLSSSISSSLNSELSEESLDSILRPVVTDDTIFEGSFSIESRESSSPTPPVSKRARKGKSKQC